MDLGKVEMSLTKRRRLECESCLKWFLEAGVESKVAPKVVQSC